MSGVGPDRVIYRDDSYMVVLHGEPQHPATIVGFQSMAWFRPTEAQPFPAPFMPPSLTRSEFPANFASFIVNRNNWYCTPEADAAARLLARALEGTRVISYGGSMGGFAAMNMAGLLEAAYFLALAPQASVAHPFMAAVHDNRYAKDINYFRPGQDHLAAGALHDREGAIIVDSFEFHDICHAGRAAALTRAQIIDMPHVGHQVAACLNAVLPLRRILLEIVEERFDVIETRRKLQTLCQQLPEWQAARPERFAPLLALCAETPAKVSTQAFLNAAKSLKLYRSHWNGTDIPWAQAVETVANALSERMPTWPANEVWMRDTCLKILTELDP